MEHTIRTALVATLAIATLSPVSVLAQAYPNKQIRMIVPFPPGGGVDFAARVVGKQLAERLGQQVIIDNRPGANGIVGLEILKQSPADGYTLAVASQGPLSINPSIYPKLPYDSLKDFAPISGVVNFPLLLVVHPSLPVKSVTELIALARKNPDQLSYSHPGAGNSGHLAGELFNSMAKVKILAVPYKGTAPAGIAVLSGEVQLTFSSIPTAAARQERQTARARRRQRAARTLAAGVSDHHGERFARLRGLCLGRHAGTGRHAEGRHCASQQGNRRRHPHERSLGPVAERRHGADADHARGIRRLHQGRDRQMGRGRTDGEYQRRISLGSQGGLGATRRNPPSDDLQKHHCNGYRPAASTHPTSVFNRVLPNPAALHSAPAIVRSLDTRPA